MTGVPLQLKVTISRNQSLSCSLSLAEAVPMGRGRVNRVVVTARISSVRAQLGRFSPDLVESMRTWWSSPRSRVVSCTTKAMSIGNRQCVDELTTIAGRRPPCPRPIGVPRSTHHSCQGAIRGDRLTE